MDMSSNARYGIASGLIGLAALSVCSLAFSLASSAFNSSDLTASLKPEQRSASLPGLAVNPGKLPTSELAGVNFTTEFAPASSGNSLSAATEDDKDWVEVSNSVNMRSGPSSANPVLKVQPEGARLQIASRDGRWIELVEPNTGQRGWVFDRHVKPADTISHRAAISGADIR